MASQAKKTLLAALVTQIATEVTDLKLVEDAVKHSAELSAGNMPCCLIADGGDIVRHNVTSQTDIDMNILIRIIADSDTTVDAVRDLDEAVIDAVETDVTLAGTCIVCLPHSADAPMLWDDTHKYLTRRFIATYRRDFN